MKAIQIKRVGVPFQDLDWLQKFFSVEATRYLDESRDGKSDYFTGVAHGYTFAGEDLRKLIEIHKPKRSKR